MILHSDSEIMVMVIKKVQSIQVGKKVLTHQVLLVLSFSIKKINNIRYNDMHLWNII